MGHLRLRGNSNTLGRAPRGKRPRGGGLKSERRLNAPLCVHYKGNVAPQVRPRFGVGPHAPTVEHVRNAREAFKVGGPSRV